MDDLADRQLGYEGVKHVYGDKVQHTNSMCAHNAYAVFRLSADGTFSHGGALRRTGPISYNSNRSGYICTSTFLVLKAPISSSHAI